MRNSKTQLITGIAILGALSGVLMVLEFPLPIAPSFYKMDFSDVALLIGGYAYGPFAAILISLIKVFINLIVNSTTTAFVGEIAAFLMDSLFAVSASLIYKKEHTKKGAIKSLIVGVLVLTISAAIINYFVLIPAYVKFMNFPLEAIVAMGSAIIPSVNSLLTLVLFCTVPFNLVKGILISIVTYLLYKHISPLLKGDK